MSKEKPFVRYKNWADQHPILSTTAETVGVVALKYGVSQLGDKANINLVNANKEVKETFDRSISEAALLFTGSAPIEEELTFRVLPDVASKHLKKSGHDVSAKVMTEVSDALFGLAHSGLFVRDKKGAIKPNFKVNRKDHAIPVTPYLGGRHYRRLTEARGAHHAVYAHSLNNGLMLVQNIIRKYKS